MNAYQVATDWFVSNMMRSRIRFLRMAEVSWPVIQILAGDYFAQEVWDELIAEAKSEREERL